MKDARLGRIVEEVSALPAAERETAIERACAEDPSLAPRIRSLLRLQAELEDVGIEASGPGDTGTGGGGSAHDFEIRALLGEGGMGTVYLAQQTRPIRRPVALKVLRLALESRGVLARFEQEKLTLARLDHPYVAKVFDAGTFPSGRPYFAMEYVCGVPIDRYCDDHRLTIRRRLELFLDVCSAIQHAHQKGIIHRDIKPSNVLVGNESGRPVPKVIDFGIAKALGPQRASTITLEHQVLGTAMYMSPEQIRGGTGVDTRSDVYSLGVVLYELLTGRTPFPHAASENAIVNLVRLVTDERPRRPSQLVTSLTRAESTRVAEQRRTGPRGLPRALRGDLDWIVLRALEKDRAQRYGTVQELAEDVENALADRPVRAGPPSGAYRFRKYVRRNRTVVVMASLLAVVLVGGFASTYRAYLAASRAEVAAKENAAEARGSRREALELAEREQRLRQEREHLARRMTAATDYLQRVLRFSDIATQPEQVVNRRSLLDLLAADIDLLADFPEWHASTSALLGSSYYGLGELAPAKHHLLEADRIYAMLQERPVRFSLRADEVLHDLRGCRHALEWLSVKRDLHRTLTDGIRVPEWERDGFLTMYGCWYLSTHVLLESTPRLGAAARELVDGTTRLANVGFRDRPLLRRTLASAEALAEGAAQIDVESPLRQVVDDQLRSFCVLLQDAMEQVPRSQPLRKASISADSLLLELRRNTLPRLHPEIGDALLGLAEALLQDEQLDLASQRAREALALRKRILGPEHVGVAVAETLLGRIEIASSREDAGLELIEPRLEQLRTDLGTRSRDYRRALETFVLAIAELEESPSVFQLDLRDDLVECYRTTPFARGGLARRRAAVLTYELSTIREGLDALWYVVSSDEEAARGLEALERLEHEIERLGLDGRPVLECIAADLGFAAEYLVKVRPWKPWLKLCVRVAELALRIYGDADVDPLHPMHTMTRHHLAMAQGLLGEYGQQERLARIVLLALEATAARPPWWYDSLVQMAHVQLASALLAQGMREQALRELERAEELILEFELLPYPEDGLLAIANVYVDFLNSGGESVGAERVLDKCLALPTSKDDLKTLASVAWIVAQLRGRDAADYEQARDFVERAFASQEGRRLVLRELLLIQAVLDARVGRLDEAMCALEEVLHAEGWESTPARAALALVHLERNEPGAARDLLSWEPEDESRPPSVLRLPGALSGRLLHEAEEALAGL